MRQRLKNPAGKAVSALKKILLNFAGTFFVYDDTRSKGVRVCLIVQVPEETQTHVDDGKDDTAKSAAEAFAEQFKIEDVEPNNAST